MAKLEKIVDKIVLQEQYVRTVDFATTRDRTGYSKNSDFEKFFKTRFFSNKEINSFCKHCIDLIIEKYGHEAYEIQQFEFDGFKFIVEYKEFSDYYDAEGAPIVYSFFWSHEEY